MYTKESIRRTLRDMEVPAEEGRLPEVLSVLEECMNDLKVPAKTSMQVLVAAEEIFVNIAHYAYGGKDGTVGLRVEAEDDPSALKLTFSDYGTPYNPLDREDPDITLPLEQRSVGGLGILMARKLMDSMSYERRGGQNVLVLIKRIEI